MKRLESDLESLEVFEEPKLFLEQYHTPPRVAAEMLHLIEMDTGLSGKTVLDLGCGCGILGLGCVNCGAKKVLGVDIDKDAVNIAERNRDDVGVSSDVISFLVRDVSKLQKEDLPEDLRTFDVVVTNPPFGTRCPNIDHLFIQKGLELSNVVYSIHKSTRRKSMIEKAKQMGVSIAFIFENLKFPLPATYSFHKLDTHCIVVDVAKFTRS